MPKNNPEELHIDNETITKASAGTAWLAAMAVAMVTAVFTPREDKPSLDAIRASTDMVTNPDHPHEYVSVADPDPARAFQITSRINAEVNASLAGFQEACVHNQGDEILEKHIGDRDRTLGRFGCPKLTTWVCDKRRVTERTPRDPVLCEPPRNFRRRASG